MASNEMRTPLWALLFLLVGLNVFSQSSLWGNISDRADSTGVSFVSVILYRYQSNKIIGYTQSDVDGNYQIEIPTELSILTLKTSRLGYHTIERDIVFGSEKDTTILLNLQLTPLEERLQEVVVSGPVIVKEDTIIYDVAHYTQARDQNLEDVLARIPGFKIGGDGEIKVNGKVVRKVLIDGEEVSDAGAALITRSISPEDVKNVEVRTDEKDTKLKESLLDATEYVVLDIKLKEGLKKSLFGKLRGTLGYQEQTEPGGYLNAFSLKKKAKIHLFVEHDRFGEQTISLDQIKNLGVEAFQKIFEIPADFQTLTEREAFQDEIFGFRDYTIAEKNIAGLSTKFTISPSLAIYFGSYNAYSRDGKGRSYDQEFNSFDFSTNLRETQKIIDYSSKNKVDVRFDQNNWKIKLDLNAVLFDNDFETLNNEEVQVLNYQYSSRHNSNSFYENLLVEHKISDKTGLQLKASHAAIAANQDKKLFHNAPSYGSTFVDEQGRNISDFQQSIDIDANNFLSEITIYHESKLGTSGLGGFYHSKKLTVGKEGTNRGAETNNRSPDFTGTGSLNVSRLGSFINHSIELGRFNFDNEVRWTAISYPALLSEQTKNNFFNIKLSAAYSAPGFNHISASFSRSVSQFPLEKLIPGVEITGFQSIVIPNRSILSPQNEMTIDLTGAKKIQDSNILFEPWILYGQVKNADRFLFSESPVISIAYDQLKAEYLAITVPITKDFKTIPIDIIIEPEWLINQSQNTDDQGTIYTTRTSRTLLGLKLNTQIENKPFDFFFYPKYSNFRFKNGLTESRSSQKMLSLNISTRLDFFDKKLLLTPGLRTVKFLGNVRSNFTNIMIRVDYAASKLNWFFSVDNLLNDSDFVRQTIYPTYFTSEQNFVFSRFLKIGLEYKFK
ncbi:MAG: hypothetical protein GDA51_12350 [Ekhidna sp.]|nr:hypothetical protein [Ekhidna sp.]